MSYPPNKAIPLAISTLDEVIKLVIRKDKSIHDDALEEIFINLFKDDTVKRDAIDEMLFKLHSNCNSAIAKMKQQSFQEVTFQKEMNEELTYKEAADELKCSPRQIVKLVGQKKITPIHYSKRTVRIKRSELERYRNSVKV